MVCVDASVFVASLLPESLSSKADSLLEQLRSAGEQLIAPSLLLVEVSSALRNAVFKKRVAPGLAQEAFEAFRRYPIRLLDLVDLVDSAWAWATAVNAPRTYDMYYVALADREACDLWTADRRLVRIVGPRLASLRWLGDMEEAP